MAKIGLSFYSVRILAPTKKEHKKEFEYISLSDVNGRTVADWIYDFLLLAIEEYHKDSEKEKVYRPYYIETCDHFVGKDYYFSSIYGIVKSGDYGVEVEIVDSGTSEKVFNQSKEQAGVLPFGFALYFTEGVSTGILVTQSFGAKGMSSQFKNIVSNSIECYCDKYKVKINSVFPDAYFKRLIDNQKIKSLCIETYRKPQKIDKDEKAKNDIIDYSCREIRYKHPIIKDKKRIFDIFSQRWSLKEIKGLTNDDEEIKNMKVDFQVNGITKTVNYDTYFNLRISENITNDVLIDDNTGHPNSLSLFKQMDDYVQMYLINMNIVKETSGNEDLNKEWKRHCHIEINSYGKEKVVDKRNERDIITV